jgi:hypothetical protein
VAKYNAHIERFNVGEYSNAALNRVDLSKTRLAAEIQENIFPHKVGKGQVRPGTTYLGRTRNDKRARLQAFARSASDKALLELTDGYLRVWVDDALVTRPSVSTTVNGVVGQEVGYTVSGAYIGGENTEGGFNRYISTSTPGVLHAVKIQITKGPILFKMGTQPGKDDVVVEQALQEGWHSISFTPSGTVYYTFTNRTPRDMVVASLSVEAAGPMEIPAPWGEDDLDNFQFEQSADTIFCANRGLRPLIIQRRTNTSWSVAYYIPQDGPWLDSPPGGGEVTLKPNSTSFTGNVTASTSVFDTSTMDEILVRVFNDRRDNEVTIGGNNTYIDPFRITGIIGESINDRQYRYLITAQGAGTLRWQRSISGEGGDYGPTSRSSSNTSTFKTLGTGESWTVDVTHNGHEEDNNLVAWHRIGFGPGDRTTGWARIRIIYEGNGAFGIGITRLVSSTTFAEVDWFTLPNAPDPSLLWQIGAWGAHAEYPSSVTLFDNRLWWGGRSRIWGSALGDFFSFNDLDTTDLATITRNLGAGGATNRSNFLLGLQRLIIGTSGAELSLRSSAIGDIVTAFNATIRTASSYGSSTVAPVRIDSRGLFIHRDGVSSMLLDFSGEDYSAGKMTEYNDGILLPSCTQLAVQRQPETYVWHVRSDGQVAMLLLDVDEPDNQLISWTRFVTAGEVESMAVLPDADQDAVYMSVKRTPRAIAQDAGYPTETGADTLMGNDSSGWAMDFTDGSVTVRWPEEPTHLDQLSGETITVPYRGTNTRDDGTFKPLIPEDYGEPPGPDRYFMSWYNLADMWSHPVYCRQADGTLKLQQHNYNNRSEVFRPTDTLYPGPYSVEDILYTTNWYGMESYDVNGLGIITVDAEDGVILSPRGDMTGSRLYASETQAGPTERYLSSWLQVTKDSSQIDDYYYGNQAGWLAFSAQPAEYSRIDVCFMSKNASFPSIWSPAAEDVGTGSSQHGSAIVYRVDLAAKTATKTFEQHAYTAKEVYIDEVDIEEQPNGWTRYHFKYLIANEEDATVYVRLVDNDGNISIGGTGDGIYIWGFSDKMDGTDNHRTYMKEYNNFFAFPSNNSRRQQLMPYEWDADGNPLGIRCYDFNYDKIDYTYGDNRYGAIGYFTEGTITDGDTRGQTGRLDGGTAYTDANKLGPDGLTRAGIWTDDDGGNAASYCGINLSRYDNFSDANDYVTSGIFAKYDGSARYFTISHVNTAAAPDSWYSVTWDVETGEITEEYYEPGGATSGAGEITQRKAKTERYANGWFRLLMASKFEATSSVYWAMSTTPTPGSQTNGVDQTTGTGRTVQVWYHSTDRNHGMLEVNASPPRPRNTTVSYHASPVGVIPMGKDASYLFYTDRVNRDVLPFDRNCWRLEQTIVPIDGWFEEEHFPLSDDAGEVPFYDYFGWPWQYNSYQGAVSWYGVLRQFSEDPKFDFVSGYKYAGFIGSPNGEISGYGSAAYEYWYPTTQFTSFPPGPLHPEGAAAPIPAIEFEVGREYNLVLNAIENFGLEMYADGVYIGNDETLNPNFVDPIADPYAHSLVYYAPCNADVQEGQYNYGEFYLKSLKVTSQCGPDEPRYIERLNKHEEALGGAINKMADAGNYFAGPVSSVTVEQHAGRGGLVAWGTRVSDGFMGPIPGPLGATSAGVVALGDTYTDVFIGLPYTARYKSAKLAYAGEGGTALEQPKKVTEFGLLLNDTHVDAIKYGEDFDRMRSMPRVYKGKPVADGTIWSEYDDVSFSMPGSWNTDSRVCLKVEAPYPATFTGLVISVETNARGGR